MRDGDVGLDRTPSGVRSPVARRDINVKSTDGVGNTVHLPISHGAIEVSAVAGDDNTFREAMNDVRDHEVRPTATNDVQDRDICPERTTRGVRSPAAHRAIDDISSVDGVGNTVHSTVARQSIVDGVGNTVNLNVIFSIAILIVIVFLNPYMTFLVVVFNH